MGSAARHRIFLFIFFGGLMAINGVFWLVTALGDLLIRFGATVPARVVYALEMGGLCWPFVFGIT